MNKIIQTMRYRQSLISYAKKHGVTKAAIRYRTNRQYIYRWLKRYDSMLQSLADRSHRPHHHPNQHRPEEIKLINDMRRRNTNAGLVVFWVKLRQREYSRSISGLYRFLRKRDQMAVKIPNPKYIPKPYEQMKYPGQRVQIDVNFVPSSCLVGEASGKKFYQYTFIGEYSRFRYLEAFAEHSTYSSSEFIKHCVQRFPYAIKCVQTDNGSEFTNSPNSSKKIFTLYSKKLFLSLVFSTNSLSLLLLIITARSNAVTVKTTNTSIFHTNSILSMISKNNLLLGRSNTTISLCVLLIGTLLNTSFFPSLFCNISLTNLHYFTGECLI